MRQIGTRIESLACAYLEGQGLICLEKNFHTRFGEIDLIMQDEDELVFVEVRYRKSTHVLSPAESIDRNKQKKIIKTAMIYLASQKLSDKVGCRFDVLAVQHSPSNPQLEWIKNAFQLQ